MNAPIFYKDKMAHKALGVVRKLASGNGVKKDAIQIIQNDYMDVECEAITHIEISHKKKEEKQNGKVEGGQPVNDPAQIPKLIQHAQNSAIKSIEARKMLSNILLKRCDKGFSLHDKYFDIPQLTQVYQYVESCKSCQGAKAVTCQRCHGKCQEQCGQCGGHRAINCNKCQGSGSMKSANGQQQTCNQCYGKRSIPCPLCRSQGVTQCRICKGTGGIKCDDCKGIGIFSFITTVTYKMKTLFEIDRAALPDVVVKMIEDNGTQLIEQKYVDLHAEQVKREDGGLAIQYTMTFPFTNIAMNVNGKPIKVSLFGFKMKIMKVTNFIDQLVEKNYALLIRAAHDDGNVVSHIRKSSKSRIIADGLLLAVTTRPKQAMITLKKKYPYAASNSLIKNIILEANKALTHVSRKSQHSGLMAGMGLYLIILAGYFIGPLRSMLNQNDNIIFDFALIPVGFVLITLLAKLLMKAPIKSALGPLMPAKQRAAFKPRTNTNIMFVTLGTLICFILITVLSRYIGDNPPSWLPF